MPRGSLNGPWVAGYACVRPLLNTARTGMTFDSLCILRSITRRRGFADVGACVRFKSFVRKIRRTDNASDCFRPSAGSIPRALIELERIFEFNEAAAHPRSPPMHGYRHRSHVRCFRYVCAPFCIGSVVRGKRYGTIPNDGRPTRKAGANECRTESEIAIDHGKTGYVIYEIIYCETFFLVHYFSFYVARFLFKIINSSNEQNKISR